MKEDSLPNLPFFSLPISSTRRGFLRRAGVAGVAAAFAPATAALLATPSKGLAAGADSADADVLNFALNLEYLEAEYYANAVFGQGLEALGEGIDGVGTPGPTIVKANPKVPFADPIIAAYAAEIAQDEINHVRFLRAELGSAAVAKPTIDLLDSFNTVAAALGIGSAFDPFATDHDFLFGAFSFEDVGVTAYHGVVPSLTDKAVLSAATGLLAVEAYHASAIRSLLYVQSLLPGQSIFTVLAQGMSDLRDGFDGKKDKDQGIVDPSSGALNIVPADGFSIAHARSTNQVLRILYGSAARVPGLFFPNGTNGRIR